MDSLPISLLSNIALWAATVGAVVWRVGRLEKDVEKKADWKDVEQVKIDLNSKASKESFEHLSQQLTEIKAMIQALLRKEG